MNNMLQSVISPLRQKFVESAGVTTVLRNTFILSATDGLERAKVITFVANLLDMSDSEWHKLFAQKLAKLQEKFPRPLKWIRLEWVTESSLHNWGDFKQILKNYKRNYFRAGIAFEGKREPWLLLTETELNANACLYPAGEIGHAMVNQHNLEIYFKARHGSSQIPLFNDDLTLCMFKTAGFFFDLASGETCEISTAPRNQGRRVFAPLNVNSSADLIQKITAYLGRQVLTNGRYEYGHFPCFGRTIGTYNTLRHASSTYALIEGYELCQKQGMQAVELAKIAANIEKALTYLLHKIIRHYSNNLAYVVEINDEIKLGANAVAILALVKYIQVFPDSNRCNDYLALCEKLANGIVAMRQPNGSFVHILSAKDLSVLAEHRIIYYDGEAAFGLMRLYGLTKDTRWLDCVTKAFDYFIEAKHYEAHDHWLSYCSNELVQYKPEKKYFQFAVDNVKGYVDFIRTRITTFPTLLELSMAFHKMLLKLDEYPQFSDVLAGFDVADFYQALHTRANYLVNGVFFPELAMFYKKPETILYGCFIRHHTFRVRIDDVEHYLSGLVAYHHLLTERLYPKSLTKDTSKSETVEYVLNAVNLELATSGKWLRTPEDSWFATNVATYSQNFQVGSLLVAQSKTMDKGFFRKVGINAFIKKGAVGVITDNPELYTDLDVPVLVVKDVRKAVLAIGRFVREQFRGHVYGITGSAGKTTTVSMLAHTLQVFGSTEQTQGSANLPIGIAWNLAKFSQYAQHWVVEMAIGQMSVNSALVQPEVAIITNIAPAHLQYHNSLEEVALKKARIFEAMSVGSLAIICRDIAQYDLIAMKAKQANLRIVSYGEHPEADIRLVSYKPHLSKIRLGNSHYVLKLEANGKHFVLNAMAILAIIKDKGLSIRKAINQLNCFKAVEGRGNIKSLTYHAKNITVYNEAYNANPLSMQVAIDAFGDVEVENSNKLMILGDMLELGEDSQQYHQQVLEYVNQKNVKRIILVGEEMTKVLQYYQIKMCKYFQHVLNYWRYCLSLLRPISIY
ncbi:UDP-N-acetylmuramoyl-tripeptide--D-alanyl-D-alanine ligase [Actinobacillus arthritidis]|uniref:UDP-N-acetylmuramoyl-tripeptide--D-alanyl-D- alanine ligase n=1 Tax=Actinobacillus arthritidis TaxID=157339 RepID=UPI002442A98C|nr:UDP-N-acetylmuramoyl-tripeptide--D-alanyl-D-alanine ligase [Actinobacillus arthritidis]WGE88962.1 UDP-N-acetylmuramoyl-tripeptide--D-alanyl-D-alanine ligase [Actinobacillus arthritidis]